MKIVGNRKKFFTGSAVVLLLGLLVIIFNAVTGNGAFNYDVEFSGGMSLTVDIGAEFDNAEVASIVTDITGFSAPQIQKVRGENQVIIKIRSLEPEVRIALVDEICARYAISENAITISDISATISGEMQKTAILALSMAFVAMLIYVSIRFRDIRTGGSAIIALMHDAFFVICCYGVLRIPLNYSFIAVLLTIIGYAINNNIVVFDRLRENRKLNRRMEIGEMIDKSINQTLTRCMYTTLTTLVTITCLYVLGVPSIKEFSLPIILGLICGTYTSICFSGCVLYEMTRKKV